MYVLPIHVHRPMCTARTMPSVSSGKTLQDLGESYTYITCTRICPRNIMSARFWTKLCYLYYNAGETVWSKSTMYVARRCLSRDEFHRTVSKISVSTAIFREGDKIKFFSDKIIQQSWELPPCKFHRYARNNYVGVWCVLQLAGMAGLKEVVK